MDAFHLTRNALRAVPLIAHNASRRYKWTTSGDKNERSQRPL